MDLKNDISQVRGFNYSPSYCTTLYESWDNFDAKIWRTEITRGKKYFPRFNALRIWLDWNPYLRNPSSFVHNLGIVLDICGEFGIKLIPTLFNRWHDFTYDFGGIYYDHLLDRNFERFDRYLNDVIGTFKNDSRIGMWDLCNEPQHWDKRNPFHQIEVDWLEWVARRIRRIGASQPITIGTMWSTNVEWVVDLCDVISFHPYAEWWNEGFVRLCDWAVEFAKIKNKPLIATETCQGSLDDKRRVEIIHRSLGPLKERKIGWCAWQLHGGRMISGNRRITDRNCKPGDQSYMAFIEPDGSLRQGHEAFNEYC